MIPALEVIEAGPSSSLQDAGRFGFLAHGVITAGPADMLLHAVANRLVGNDLGTAAVEVLIRGGSYLVSADSCRLAVAGDFGIKVDDEHVSSWRTYTLRRGQVLTIGHATRGLRGYLAVAGGFDITPVLGSLSVHTRSKIGPLGGRHLKEGMVLKLHRECAVAGPDQRFDTSVLPTPKTELRVVLGPQDSHFTSCERERFASSDFFLSTKCDRMGCQLLGPEIDFNHDLPLISEGIALGSVQVIGRGLFIIALVDRQTVGGYPKIATVIGPDIRDIAQMKPSTNVCFRPIDIINAQELARTRYSLIKTLDTHVRQLGAIQPTVQDLLSTNLISGVYFSE